MDVSGRQNDETASAQTGGFADIVVGATLALIVWICLCYFAVGYGDGKYARWLLAWGVSATALGWLIGILLSPYNVTEKTSFSTLTKTAYGFATGYLLSKFDPLLTRIFSDGIVELDERVLPTLLVVFSCLCVAVGNTYVSRSYWNETSIYRMRRGLV